MSPYLLYLLFAIYFTHHLTSFLFCVHSAHVATCWVLRNWHADNTLRWVLIVMQRQTTVTAYLKSKQLLLSVFAVMYEGKQQKLLTLQVNSYCCLYLQ